MGGVFIYATDEHVVLLRLAPIIGAAFQIPSAYENGTPKRQAANNVYSLGLRLQGKWVESLYIYATDGNDASDPNIDSS